MRRALTTIVVLLVAVIAAGNLSQHRRYTAGTAQGDGNDHMRITSSGPTGLADAKTVTVSAWFRIEGSDATQYLIWKHMTSTGTTRFQIARATTNKIAVLGRNAANTTILNIEGSTNVLAGSGWHHVLAAFDMANSSNRFIYLDGVAETLTPTTYTDDTLDLAVGTNAIYAVGSEGSTPSSIMVGSFSEIIMNDTYEPDVTKFRTATGRPKSLGTDGSLPFGAQPVWYFRGTGSGFNVSSGTAANMTITGTYVSTTSP